MLYCIIDFVSFFGDTLFIKSIDASRNTKNVEFLCEALEGAMAKVGENVVQVCFYR